MRISRRMPLIIILLLPLMAGACYGQTNGSSVGKQPITIDADRMEARQRENAVTFSGHVEARQGDFAINADTITLYYSSETAKQSGDQNGPALAREVSKLVGRGNVELRRQGWSASGDSIEYFAREGKVVLTGNTKVLRDNNLISAERIVLFLDEEKSVVESPPGESGGRVKVIINPTGATPATAPE